MGRDPRERLAHPCDGYEMIIQHTDGVSHAGPVSNWNPCVSRLSATTYRVDRDGRPWLTACIHAQIARTHRRVRSAGRAGRSDFRVVQTHEGNTMSLVPEIRRAGPRPPVQHRVNAISIGASPR
jgi:hypothetical protein